MANVNTSSIDTFTEAANVWAHNDAMPSADTGMATKSDRIFSWWRHQMETFSALLDLCAGNSPVTGEVLAQRPVTRSCDVFGFFYLRLNKRLSEQSWGWWFETPSCSLWRHCNLFKVSRVVNVSNMFRLCRMHHVKSPMRFLEICGISTGNSQY